MVEREVLLFVTKVLVLDLYLIEKVLDVFQVLVLANVKKYFYLTQVLWKVLDPNPGCNSCNLYVMWTMSIQDAAFWYDLFIRPKWCTWNNMWGRHMACQTILSVKHFRNVMGHHTISINWKFWHFEGILLCMQLICHTLILLPNEKARFCLNCVFHKKYTCRGCDVPWKECAALTITPSHQQNTHDFADGRKNMNDIFNDYVCSVSHMRSGLHFQNV